MYRWYKSGCNPILGSPFASLGCRRHKYPTANWATVISLLGPCQAPLKFLNKLSGFELSLHYRVSTSQLNHQAALLQNPSGECWLISCICVPDHVRHNLASKVEQEPLSFEGAGHARPFRSSILLVSGSCGVSPLREPTGIGHRNLLPVSIPSTLKSVITGIIGRNYWQCFPDLQDPGQDRCSRYIWVNFSHI